MDVKITIILERKGGRYESLFWEKQWLLVKVS